MFLFVCIYCLMFLCLFIYLHIEKSVKIDDKEKQNEQAWWQKKTQKQ